jgi:hypothetical protein
MTDINNAPVNTGKCTLVTFPKSGNSISIEWKEKFPKYNDGWMYRDDEDLQGVFYYAGKKLKMRSGGGHLHRERNREEEIIRFERDRVASIPCKYLVLDIENQAPYLKKLEEYEEQPVWSFSARNERYEDEAGFGGDASAQIKYTFNLTEMSCTYHHSYSIDRSI